ncbi:MAG TPA: discoidin domain-containing protein, partial [Planctomycetota bacterium]|nr:discoidin domain-containing protein [Planctomycetota bacterium]
MLRMLKSYGWFAAALLLAASAERGLFADVNVALGKTALQSTTGFGGDASRAVDGNTSGNYGDNSMTHTAAADPAPSWEVDLGEEFDISRIVLWNRTDCCMWRLSNFRISILDSFGTEVEGEDFFTDLTFPDTTVDGFEWDVPAGTTGQTVRIDSLGPDSMATQYVSLAEVQVFSDAADIAPSITGQPRGGKAFVGGSFTLEVQATGSDPLTYQWQRDGADLTGKTSSTLLLDPVAAGDEGSYTVVVTNPVDDVTSDPVVVKVFTGRNLALDGEASQSTTAFGGDAPRAIDGNTSGAYGNNSVTHTAGGDASPSWEVLLVGPSTIEAIYIWGRTDCCLGRLSNFRVRVLDTERNEVFSEDFFTDGSFPDTALEGFEVLLPPGTVGQIVRVELLGDLIAAG